MKACKRALEQLPCTSTPHSHRTASCATLRSQVDFSDGAADQDGRAATANSSENRELKTEHVVLPQVFVSLEEQQDRWTGRQAETVCLITPR